MDKHDVVAILNELVRLEQAGTALRLMESGVFVSPMSVDALAAVERLAGAAELHTEELSGLILDLGGAPAHRAADARSADLHFQEVVRVLPRLIAEQKTLLGKYALAAERLTGDLKASALVAQLADRHRETLSELAVLNESAGVASS